MSTGKRLVLEDEFLDGEENDSKQSQQQTQDSSNHNNNRQIIITVNNSGVTNKNGSDPSKERNSNPAVANMIEAHRKSLISLGGIGGGGGGGGGAGAGGSLGQNGQPQFTADDLAQFTSITLSKRHFFTETEYEKGADLDTFKKLSEFKFDETTSNSSANNSGGAVAVSGSKKTTGE